MEENRFEKETVVNVDIEKEVKKSFLDYSMSVIVSRALPDVRDGLKPVHRRILYSMQQNGLTHDKPTRKSANIVGAVLADFHPHGDASVYDAMVRLAQPFSMRYPLIEGQGNFGSVDGDPPAAYRYTEARMSKFSALMLEDIDKETVNFSPNYDDTQKEPDALPTRIPNLLVNGSTGIAVGMATNIPPHNLGETISALEYVMDNPECSPLDIMEVLPGPDFPTGGIIMGRSGIRSAYATGRGKIILRGRAEIEPMRHDRERIVITEIPYMVNKARMVENIADLVKEKRIEGISDLRDESDRKGMRVVVELKRDANAQVVLNQLYRFTQLQDTVGVIMLALHDGQPKVMNIKELLCSYIDFRRDVVRRRTEFDLRRARDRAHILEGLARAIDIMDDIIATIRSCKGGQAEAKVALMEKFEFDEPQAAAICAFQLGRLAGLEILKIENELQALHQKIQDYEDILSNDAHMLRIIREELEEVREKYADERRTDIAAVSGEVDIEDLIPQEDCIVTLTNFGYVKRQPCDSYTSQRRGGRGIQALARRDEDFVKELFVANSHDYLLFITTMGRVYSMKSYEIPEGSRTARGGNIVNLLPLMTDEKISSVLRVESFDGARYIDMVTRKGIIKRTALSAFANIRKSGIYGITLDEGDELAWAKLSDGNSDVFIATRLGMAIRFNDANARPMGRTARGVKALTLKEGDEVVGMCVVNDGEQLLTVTENGKGRLSRPEDYRVQNRGGLGIRNYDCAGRSTKIASVLGVTGEDDVIMISQNGIIIRMHVSDITTQSRYGSGVRVMRLGEDDRIVTVARTDRDDSEPTELPTDEGDTAPEGQNPMDDELAAEIAEHIADEEENLPLSEKDEQDGE